MGSDDAFASGTSDPGTPTTQGETQRSWRMAEQYFRDGDFAIDVLPYNDGYAASIKMGLETRRVFFDPAGRITRVVDLKST